MRNIIYSSILAIIALFTMGCTEQTKANPIITEPEETVILYKNGDNSQTIEVSKNEVDLEDVIKAFGQEVKQVVLGFTPKDKTGYTMQEVQEEDTTLFVKGNAFAGFDKEQVRFPTLAHA